MASYLPSGTSYPTQLSNTFPGSFLDGNDGVSKFYNTAADLTVSGVSTVVNTSRVLHNYSGAVNYVIDAPTKELQYPLVGFEVSATPATFRVYDMFGGAAGATITVSGTGAVRINGATTATITAAYGVKTFTNISGAVWSVA